MGMTRKQLANTNAKEVRRKPELFALFQKYAEADAHLMYSTGRLPAGCFGCQFKSFFSRWKDVTLSQNSKTTTMKESKNFKLKNATTKFYFDGKILDRNSSNAEWLRWINYPGDTQKVEERKNYFEVLPLSEDSKPEVKAAEQITEVVGTESTEVQEVVKAPVRRTRKKKTV